MIPATHDGRRADTERRRQRAATAVKKTAENGTPISVSAIARQAGADRSFLCRHRDLPETVHAAEFEPAAQDPAGGSPVSRPLARPTLPIWKRLGPTSMPHERPTGA